jgi:putative aminopeptidase FrvX
MLLKKLTEASGVSGNEKEVRDLIYEEILPYVDTIKIDRLGNLIAEKKGRKDYPRIMLAAHMDEVGFIVQSIDENGFIKFLPVGGIDNRILISKVVEIGRDKIKGVIGAKPIHLQEANERNTVLQYKQLYIDIGAKSKEEAEKLISKGDYISFISEYIEFGDSLVKAKALDDRTGCAILVELLKKNFNSTILAVFSVQEEIGLRGASVAAYTLDPDIAIVLEGTTCYDVTGVDEPLYGTRLGLGPSISIMDMASYFDKKISKKLLHIAEENKIQIQFRQAIVGANDAGKIHLTKEGIPTAGLSIPCRYIHSPVSVMNINDFYNCIHLLNLFLEQVKKEEFIYA